METDDNKNDQTDDRAKRSAAAEKRGRARRRRKWIKRILLLAAALGAVALVAIAMRPSPLEVDSAKVRRGPLAVTLVEPGKTRLRDRHILRAPINGNLTRVELWEGDTVAGEAVVARLTAIAPPLLSARDRRQAEGRLAAARASLKVRRAEAERARLAQEQVKTRLARFRKLAAGGALPKARVTDLEASMAEATQAAASAAFGVSVSRGEVRAAEAILGTGTERSSASEIELRAPIDGIVLRVLRRDAGPVAAGEPLLEFGSMQSLEVVVDVLTADAVGIPDSAVVRIRGWGGDDVAMARVSRVEPAGFTRISALGVEEQRVNIVARFDEAQPPPARLGDAFRVEAEIVLWESKDAVTVAAGAVFRDGDKWAVYKLVDDVAVLTHVELGHRGDFDVEIASGLAPGDEVVVHPGDQLSDGATIKRR